MRFLAVLLLAGPAFGQQGSTVFEDHCASCHSVALPAATMAGPNLAGLIGRNVGSAPGFQYSGVLRAAGARGDVWTTARLREFLDGPDDMYPGLWMGGTSVRAAAEKDAMVEYLTTR